MSKRGFVRGARTPAPPVPPARVIVAPPLALPEREPRNILLMIALPAVLVGIIGTLVVMYASGVRCFIEAGPAGLARCIVGNTRARIAISGSLEHSGEQNVVR